MHMKMQLINLYYHKNITFTNIFHNLTYFSKGDWKMSICNKCSNKHTFCIKLIVERGHTFSQGIVSEVTRNVPKLLFRG
mgnify:CR=1 FL=1